MMGTEKNFSLSASLFINPDTKELLEFFTVLKEEGFFDPKEPYVLSLEVKLWKDEDADIILANTKRVINRAWALVED